MNKFSKLGLLGILLATSASCVNHPLSKPNRAQLFKPISLEYVPTEAQLASLAALKLGNACRTSQPQQNPPLTLNREHSYFFASTAPWQDLNNNGRAETNEFGEIRTDFKMGETIYFHLLTRIDHAPREVALSVWRNTPADYREIQRIDAEHFPNGRFQFVIDTPAYFNKPGTKYFIATYNAGGAEKGEAEKVTIIPEAVRVN